MPLFTSCFPSFHLFFPLSSARSHSSFAAHYTTIMAPRVPSRKDPVDKESPRKSPKKTTGRPSSKPKQTAAEARAEQEIDAEPRATRSKNSQSSSTSNLKAASPTKVTKNKRKESSKIKKTSKPAHDKAVDDGASGSEKSKESATAVAKKSKKVATSDAGGPAKDKKPRGRPPGKKTPASSYQDLLKVINKAAYEAVLGGGIEALTAYQDYHSNASIAENDYVNATNAGAMAAIKEALEHQRLKKSARLQDDSSGQTHVEAGRRRHLTQAAIAATKLDEALPGIKIMKKKKMPQARKKKAVPAITPPVSPTKANLKAQMERQRADELKLRNQLLRSGLPVSSATTDRDIPLPGLSELSQRGNMISSTNPGIISIMVDDHAQDRINPFFETLPGPEIWYRNMPPFFNFGETKFMEQQISDQINEDLARGKVISSMSAVSYFFFFANATSQNIPALFHGNHLLSPPKASHPKSSRLSKACLALVVPPPQIRTSQQQQRERRMQAELPSRKC